MAGITDLDALLRDLSPRRREGEFVYVSTVKSTSYTAAVGKTIRVAAGGAISYA